MRKRRSRRKTCGGDVGVNYIILFDIGVNQFGGAFTGADWRRMKNSSSNSIRRSTHHSSSYRGNIYYSLCHSIRIYRLDHRFYIKWGRLNA